VINLISFSLAGQIMHTNLKEYQTFRDALKNLFFASFGEFDFDS